MMEGYPYIYESVWVVQVYGFIYIHLMFQTA